MSALYLGTPTLPDLLVALDWRQACRATLRTSRDLTQEEQSAFYRTVVCNPASPHRYYAVKRHIKDVDQDRHEFVALVSLEHISWENGHAEIGLIVDPARHGQGIGREAVSLVLDVAFRELRLMTVWGESYLSGHPMFWDAVMQAYHGSSVIWPRRKFWNGTLYDAVLFTLTREGWEAYRGHG
jgi:RimJ/RimL family protein N-acetyltransferase